jgi:hypothetical protein
MSIREMKANRIPQIVRHGHVAIVMPGFGPSGWPLAYWGSKGGTSGANESLSLSFRQQDRDTIHYFAYIINSNI